VTPADGIHLDDLAIEQLKPVVLSENAGLGHAMELIHREALGGDLGDHNAILPGILRRPAKKPSGRSTTPFAPYFVQMS
jgi:hypothetical protein